MSSERAARDVFRDSRAALPAASHEIGVRRLLVAQSPAMPEGQPPAIRNPGTFEANGAKAAAVDIVCPNGVIHVIDAVLIPPVKMPTPSQAASAEMELAVERGVPLFNAGQPAACAAVYEVAIESPLKPHTDFSGEKDRSALQAALNKMRGEKDPRQQAWTLRRALDAAYESLAGNWRRFTDKTK